MLLEGAAAIAVDGKAVRGLHGDDLPGGRLVAAYSVGASLVVGQPWGRGQPKSSELGAGWELLAELDLTGKAVTGDALYAQLDLSRDIVVEGGD